MPLFKDEDLARIPADLAEQVRNADLMYDDAIRKAKTGEEAQKIIEKIYKSGPKGLKKFKEINEDAKLGLQIPDSPLEAYTEPLKKEIEDLKKDKAEDVKRQAKKEVLDKMAELGVPESEWDNLGKFSEEKRQRHS